MSEGIPIRVKRECCRMKREGTSNAEIYEYYKQEVDSACSRSSFRSLLHRWMKKRFADETTLDHGEHAEKFGLLIIADADAQRGSGDGRAVRFLGGNGDAVGGFGQFQSGKQFAGTCQKFLGQSAEVIGFHIVPPKG